MRRILKSLLSSDPEPDGEPPAASFDDLLLRELDEPTFIDLEAEPPSRHTAGEVLAETLDSTAHENDLLRAEMMPGNRTGTDGLAGSIGLAGLADGLIDQGPGPTSIFERSPRTTAAPAARTPAAPAPPESESIAAPGPLSESESTSESGWESVSMLEPAGAAGVRPVSGFQQIDFWDRYDEAAAAANLFAVPPAAITVVIGPLDVAVGVAQRCRAGHWVSDCDVFVLTEEPEIPTEPTWTVLRRPSDVVAVLENSESDFPLLVIDIQRELPAWVRPLVVRLRESGVGLVHYVLDDDPSNEDLATWHGELGRPSVLDLAAHVAPGRVLELLDRGEPIASVAGMPISTELLLALRLGAE